MIEYNRMVAEIDLDNIAWNMRQTRNHVPETSRIMAVVKADAYGHGAVEASKVLLYNGADCLGVAISDEGVQLREHNIHVPILVLGYTPVCKFDDIIKYNLTQTVFSLDMAMELSKQCISLNKTVDIHLKIDTGMSRLGFLPDNQALKDIVKISNLKNLNIAGIYSHFSTADTKDKAFSREQYGKFIDFVNLIKTKISDELIVHISNSAAILDLKEYSLDLVRPGIILYGLYPSGEVSRSVLIKPSMTVKTKIANIKTLDSGVSVGYGRTYFTKRKTIVATIPVGYADGYGRRLSNIGRILVGGQYANIIGNICMDQFMVDITEIESVRPGDEAILVGRQGENEILAEELSCLQDTINYEIICNFGKRVPRVYIKNGNPLRTVMKI